MLAVIVFVVMVIALLGVGWWRSRQPAAAVTAAVPGGTASAAPLPGYWRRAFFGALLGRTLVAAGPHVVVLRYGVGVRVAGAVNLAVGLLVLGIGLTQLSEGPAVFLLFGLLYVLGGLAFALAGLHLLFNLGLLRFDRLAGEFTTRRLLGRTTRRLSEIRAVQFISGGVHKSEDGDYETFQVNLLLDDRDQPRLNVMETQELDETRQVARRLAEFLGMPLQDALAGTQTTGCLENMRQDCTLS
jgi:hypothetical protein